MGCCLSLITTLIILFVILKIWLKLVIAWDRSYTCLVGKTVIVTGANSGIGYYTALDLAKRGARVILACRNKTKAEIAKENIIEATGNPNVVVKIIDLASFASVRQFAKDINATEERLDILVNNAGIIGFGHPTSEDGLNLYMQTNHFSPFLLTHLLIGLLKKTAPSRIVNLSSIAHAWAKIDVNNLNRCNKGREMYGTTKLCNVFFTNELAKKLKGSNVDTNSVHPGCVRTNVINNLPKHVKMFLNALSKATFRTAEEGAQTVIYAAVSKDLQGVSGEYLDNGRIAWLPPMNSIARDEELAKKVWEKTEEFVKLTNEERLL